MVSTWCDQYLKIVSSEKIPLHEQIYPEIVKTDILAIFDKMYPLKMAKNCRTRVFPEYKLGISSKRPQL